MVGLSVSDRYQWIPISAIDFSVEIFTWKTILGNSQQFEFWQIQFFKIPFNSFPRRSSVFISFGFNDMFNFSQWLHETSSRLSFLECSIILKLEFNKTVWLKCETSNDLNLSNSLFSQIFNGFLQIGVLLSVWLNARAIFYFRPKIQFLHLDLTLASFSLTSFWNIFCWTISQYLDNKNKTLYCHSFVHRNPWFCSCIYTIESITIARCAWKFIIFSLNKIWIVNSDITRPFSL